MVGYPNIDTLPHSMAISKRANSPYWYIQFQFNGKSYIKSSRSTDKAHAENMEAQWRNQLLQQQQFGAREPISIQKAFQLYATSKNELASHKALTRWCNRATKFWSHLEYVHEIKTKEIEAWRQSLQQDGLGNQSIKHAMNQVGATIKYMKKMGYLVSDIDMPKIRLPKGRLRYLSFEEETQFLKEINPYREVKGLPTFEDRHPELKRQMIDFYDMVILLLDTGARHGEICALEWDKINLAEKSIALWRPKVRNESVIYMTDRVLDVLTRRYATKSGTFIFQSKAGLARNHITHTFQKAFKRAGIAGCTAHTLRHTHATRLIQHGMNLYEVKEILGHADIKTTMRYAHIEKQSVSVKARDVMNRLNNQLTE